MKIKNISKSLLVMMSLSSVMVACNDDDVIYDGPGAPTPDDCPIVYFSDDNQTDFVNTLEDELSINVKLQRENTRGSIDMPLILESDYDCFKIPETVHFEDGQESATIKVSFPDIPTKVQTQFTLKVPDEYTNVYSTNTGWRYTANVLVSRWIKIIKDIEFWGADNKGNGTENVWCYSDMYWFEGVNKFRLENFFESGVDLTYEMRNDNDVVFDPEDPSTWDGYVYPLDHFQFRTGGNSWYLLNDEGERFTWTMSTGYTTPLSMYFYTNNSSINSLEFYDFNVDNEYGTHGFTRIANTSNTYVWMYWNAEDFKIEGYDD